MTSTPIIPVVLCGGAGSRLWPLSRRLHPKPFIELADGESLLQKAFRRGASLPEVHDLLVITNRDFVFKTRDDFDEMVPDLPRPVTSHFMLEPEPRNTAAAVAAAALWVARRYGDSARVLVLPADHLIENEPAFSQAVETACVLAERGHLVTFGIHPTRPETGYGYIEHSGTDVLAFVEKPDAARANDYLQGGRHLWNAGMFCFTAGTVLSEMELHARDILTDTRLALEHARVLSEGKGEQIELHPDYFAAVRAESIDYALMEHTGVAAVVGCDIGWSDIGSWEALGSLTPVDEHGNRVQGEAILEDTSDCFIRTDRLVGMLGVQNLTIVDTPDALLVADRSRAQDVKRIYARLQEAGHELHELHQTVYRPWGSYTVLEDGLHFKIKRLVVRPGGQLSLQLHHHRSEHWVVVSGTAVVENDGESLLLTTNQSTYILAGHRHRVANPGSVDLVMIEVQTGEYLGEDDIVRFDDAYGRL